MNSQNVVYNSQTAVINLPHYKYVDKVLSRSCYEELNELFKDADSPTKEISESYSAFSQLKRVCKIGNRNWIHIGDGSRARTAAIFSLMSKSNNISIDPNIRLDILNKWIEKYQIQRFSIIKDKFENCIDNIKESFGYNYSIVCVHSHVNLEEVDLFYPDWEFLYTSVCCYPNQQKFNQEYMKEHQIYQILNKIDLGILSERREIAIYKKWRNYESLYNKNISM